MLFGEDLGRRHERDLLAALDRLQRRERRDDRLAGADVALQQPLHRRRMLEVVRDLAPHALLRARQLERHAREQRLRQGARPREHRRAPLRPRLPMRLERQLLREQLVELEARPRRMRACVERALRQLRQPRRRRVQEPDRVAELPQLAPRDQLFRQRLVRVRGVRRQRARDELAQRLLREARRRRVHGRQPVRQRRVVDDDLELRVHDLHAEVAGPHVAEHAQARARLQRLLLARIEREEAQHELRVAPVRIRDQADQLPPRPVLDVRVDDHAFRLHGEARREGRKRHQPRVILVAQRKVQDEVGVARDADARELISEAAARGLPRRALCVRFLRDRHAASRAGSTHGIASSGRPPSAKRMMRRGARATAACIDAAIMARSRAPGMSPTIFVAHGYRFFFFSREEERPHVHVTCADGEAKFWLEPSVELAQNFRLNDRQLRAIAVLVHEHEDSIRRAWRDHFGR